jgi:uncharacterized membrane protein YfcA
MEDKKKKIQNWLFTKDHGVQSGTAEGSTLKFFGFPLLIIIIPMLHLITSIPPKVTVLTTLHSFTFFASELVASSLTQYLAGHRVSQVKSSQVKSGQKTKI